MFTFGVKLRFNYLLELTTVNLVCSHLITCFRHNSSSQILVGPLYKLVVLSYSTFPIECN